MCLQAGERVKGFYLVTVSKCVICKIYLQPTAHHQAVWESLVVAALLVELELEVVVQQNWSLHRPWPSISGGITAWQLQLRSLNTASVETSGGRWLQGQQDSKQRQEKEWRGRRASQASAAAENSLKCVFFTTYKVVGTVWDINTRFPEELMVSCYWVRKNITCLHYVFLSQVCTLITLLAFASRRPVPGSRYQLLQLNWFFKTVRVCVHQIWQQSPELSLRYDSNDAMLPLMGWNVWHYLSASRALPTVNTR